MQHTNLIHIKQLEKSLAVFLAISILAATVGFLAVARNAEAANLTSISDTLSDSDLNVPANHTIRFTTPTGVSSSQTVVYIFPTAASQFSSTSIGSLLENDIDLVVGASNASTTQGGCSGTFAVNFATSVGATTSSVTLTLCSGFNLNAGASTTLRIGTNAVDFGTGANRITNPNSASSYEINIRGTMADSGDFRVAIIDDVVVTASVDTSLTFTISGLGNGTDVNGTSTTATSTATTLAFGTLPVGSPVTMGQRLNVSTNAAQGFTVTVVEDQNLLSSTGADIDLFADANATATPSTWVAPSNSISNENTWGHIGLTSEDDLNSNEFGTALFVGNFNAARAVFNHSGPADGTTVNIGETDVAFRVQITALQEAGDDYTNTLTYVATPTF